MQAITTFIHHLLVPSIGLTMAIADEMRFYDNSNRWLLATTADYAG